MKTNISHRIRTTAAFVLLSCGILHGIVVRAETPQDNNASAIEVGTSYHHDVSPPLRELAVHANRKVDASSAQNPLGILPPAAPDVIPQPILVFDGITG